jgi:uncharacterized protein YdiU (UPF0061 family)
MTSISKGERMTSAEAYGSTVLICLARFADCLIPLFHVNESTAVEILNQELALIPKMFEAQFHSRIATKLGVKKGPDS